MRFKLKIVLHGKSLRIRLKEHGSVGIWSEVNYDSTRFDMQSDFKYNRSEESGCPGGDDGNPNTYTYKMLLPNDYKQQ